MSGPSAAVDVVVVGAGPAGLNAACSAAVAGASVTLLDLMPTAGGRVWAGASPERDRLLAAADRLGVSHRPGVRVVAAEPGRLLLEHTSGSAQWLPHHALVLATGARELQLPFDGWTLPGVMAAGGLQLLVKGGASLAGRSLVVAGSGPLLLAAAATARAAGADVLCIAEQAPWSRVAGFASQLRHWPDRLWQALQLRTALAATRYRCGWRLQRADAGPDGRLQAVQLIDAQGRDHRIACDLLAISHGLQPELQLPLMLGLAIDDDGAVCTDGLGRCSLAGVWAAGETRGIGGVHKAQIEGRIAGFAAAGRDDLAAILQPALQRERRYAQALRAAFACRLQEAPPLTPQTLVCRCEDVPWSAVGRCSSWREARLHHRCGMGACQGRLCGTALQLHRGWPLPQDVRPPLAPARVATLTALNVCDPD